MKYELHKPTDYGFNLCEGCLEKQREIDRLREEVQRLKVRLNQRKRQQKEGVFGSSTPSSLKPLKPNSKQGQSQKRGGAKNGHPGHGRLLSTTMHLHGRALNDEQYYHAARKIKKQIEQAMKADAQHLGIRRIQDLLVEKADRMCQ